MKTVKSTFFYVLIVLCSLVLLGCSQQADENKPLSEVKAEAEKMDTSQLRDMAMKYKEAITAKNVELEKIIAQLKEISPTEALGEQARSIKEKMSGLTTSVNALKERFEVYYQKLKEKGGDTSGLEI